MYTVYTNYSVSHTSNQEATRVIGSKVQRVSETEREGEIGRGTGGGRENRERSLLKDTV